MWLVGTETCAYGLCSMMTQRAVSTQRSDGSPRRCCTDEQICNESTAKSSDPRFHDLQITCDAGVPEASSESETEPPEPGRTEAPAVWKLNSSEFIEDQSTSLEAAACWRKAMS